MNKDGLCIDDEHCLEKNDDGSCKKCQNDDYGTYCVNKYFGCETIFSDYNCLECSDYYDLFLENDLNCLNLDYFLMLDLIVDLFADLICD